MWKSIDDRYSVSEDGQVMDHKRNVLCKLCISNVGYYRVSLYGKMIAVHRLVGQAFVPNPQNKPNINHLDNNRINNHYSNLQWCTQSENILYSYTHNNRKSARAKIPAEDLKYIKESLLNDTHDVKYFMNKYNVTNRCIYAIKAGLNSKRAI